MVPSFFLWQRESWRAFWHQRSVIAPLVLAATLVLATWVVVVTAPAPFENSFILRYSIYIGTNWLAAPSAFWWIPMLATLCLGINVFFAYTLARRTLVLRYLWLWFEVAVSAGWFWLALLLRQFNG